MIRVLVVDDHQLVLNGFMQLLSEASDIEVVGGAESGDAAIRMAAKLKPDVVVMDVQMPGIDGIEVTRRIRRVQPNIQIVAISAFDVTPYPEQTREAGAIGFLSKRCAAEELHAAIRYAYMGQPYISADVARRIAVSKMVGDSPMSELSSREVQVLLLVSIGARNKSIAEELKLSEKTVSTYKKRLFDKLGVSNDVELTHYALRHNLVQIS